MFRLSATATAIAVLAMGTGCASAPTAKLTPSRSSTLVSHEIDQDYVRKVELYARMRGIDIIWVHPPVKRQYSD